MSVGDQFLLDPDVCALATTNLSIFRALQGYSIKRDLLIEIALHHHEDESRQTDKATSTASSFLGASESSTGAPMRFGRVRGVIVGGPPRPRPSTIIFNPFVPAPPGPPAVKAKPVARPLTLESLQQQLDELPAGVRRLSTGYTFNLVIDRLNLPSSLRSVHFGDWFDQQLNLVELPNSLEEICFGERWNRPVTQLPTLHEGLQKLVFGEYFNRPIMDLYLPASLLLLEFGDGFAQPVEGQLRLPPKLQSLRFGSNFSQPIERLPLPASLTQLHLGFSFNHPLLNWTPPTALTDLILGWRWNLPSSQLKLPEGLREFQLPAEFQPKDGIEHLRLPSSLTSLQFGSTHEWPCSARWAKKRVDCYTGHFDMPLTPLSFPPALRRLHLGVWFDRPLTNVQWSSTLTHLTLSALFHQPLQVGDLPPTLRVLDMSLCRKWNYPLQSHLYMTSSIEKLLLPFAFDIPLTLPMSGWAPSLTSLHLGYCFGQPLLDWSAPSHLQDLHLGFIWNLPVSQLGLPSTLRSLTFAGMFDQPVDQLQLPSSLRVLRLASAMFNQPVGLLHLPAGLEVLQLGFDSHADRTNTGQFNQSLHQLHLPSSLRMLCLPTYAFQQPIAALPTHLPSSLQVLHLHSPRRMDVSGWGSLNLSSRLEIEFGEPLNCRCVQLALSLHLH